MPFSIACTPERLLLKLEGAVTIRHAEDLARDLAARLLEDPDDSMPIQVDTSGVEDIDTCILQMLCSLRKSVPAFSFINPSEAFTGAVDRCGLRREFLAAREVS